MLYLKDYASAMKPFADALDFLQGEKGVFYGTLIPTLVTIKTKIDRIINNGKENYLKQQLIFLQSRLFDRFEKYFTLSSEINDAIVAAVLHPEVKLQWFAPIRDLTRKSVDEVKKLVIDYVADNHVVDCDAAEDLILSRIGSFYDFGDEQNSFEQTTDVLSIDREVNLYLADPFFNDLKKLKELPLLEKAFRKANTPLTSSAPVERLFSFAGIVNTPRRHALSDDHFEMLTLMKANAHFLK
ncbi:uncharacterized protein LOC118734104 [Rhagoletis pomonella]|uniref:uncharacterized protein LOC118734104 n=1 Tax=Rhagoletis pomonella TaxID=28610 RepID=UPI00178208A7|nr:uncharacterized protein LOC118734104 [Rhagoletis pomonella]